MDLRVRRPDSPRPPDINRRPDVLDPVADEPITISGSCNWWLRFICRAALALSSENRRQICEAYHLSLLHDYLPVPYEARRGFVAHMESLRFFAEGQIINWHCTTCGVNTQHRELFKRLHGWGLRECVQSRPQARPNPNSRNLPLVSDRDLNDADRAELEYRERHQSSTSSATPA